MPILKTRQICKIRDRDTQGLVHCASITERQRARRSPGQRHRPNNSNYPNNKILFRRHRPKYILK